MGVTGRLLARGQHHKKIRALVLVLAAVCRYRDQHDRRGEDARQSGPGPGGVRAIAGRVALPWH